MSTPKIDSPIRVSRKPYTWSEIIPGFILNQKIDSSKTQLLKLYDLDSNKDVHARPVLDDFDLSMSQEVLSRLDKKEDNAKPRN